MRLSLLQLFAKPGDWLDNRGIAPLCDRIGIYNKKSFRGKEKQSK